jgi:hypothetical protein
MLQELSHMDRITQLQDEIQQVRASLSTTSSNNKKLKIKIITTAAHDHVNHNRVPHFESKFPPGLTGRADNEAKKPREIR